MTLVLREIRQCGRQALTNAIRVTNAMECITISYMFFSFPTQIHKPMSYAKCQLELSVLCSCGSSHVIEAALEKLAVTAGIS